MTMVSLSSLEGSRGVFHRDVCTVYLKKQVNHGYSRENGVRVTIKISVIWLVGCVNTCPQNS